MTEGTKKTKRVLKIREIFFISFFIPQLHVKCEKFFFILNKFNLLLRIYSRLMPTNTLKKPPKSDEKRRKARMFCGDLSRTQKSLMSMVSWIEVKEDYQDFFAKNPELFLERISHFFDTFWDQSHK